MDPNELLEVERVRIDVEASSKKKALETVSELIAGADESLGASRILEALFQRERLGCTSIGDGVALPHARIEGLRHPVAAFVRLAEPIEFESHDDKRVQFIFGLIVPHDDDQDDDEHNPDIGALAHRLADPALRLRLAEARSDDEAFEALCEPPPVEPGIEASG